jgi:GNAT superfamily N-acetyltransferase
MTSYFFVESAMPLNIRPATREDASLILRFITELAIYERAEHEVKTDVAGIETSLFCQDASASALICERDGQPIGYAVYFFNYSTWLGRNGLYLEDLYVTPEARGTGAGKALLKHLARLALAHDCGRFEWSVLDWNEPAIQFYESLGARPQEEWTTYRLTGAALLALAEQP